MGYRPPILLATAISHVHYSTVSTVLRVNLEKGGSHELVRGDA